MHECDRTVWMHRFLWRYRPLGRKWRDGTFWSKWRYRPLRCKRRDGIFWMHRGDGTYGIHRGDGTYESHRSDGGIWNVVYRRDRMHGTHG